MKALVVRQPHAGRILSGEKRIETRTWSTKYSGPLLICVSKKGGGEFGGKAICVVWLNTCVPMTEAHVKDACVAVYPRAFSWMLARTPYGTLDIRKIKPFKVKGRLGLFEVRVSEEMLKPVEPMLP